MMWYVLKYVLKPGRSLLPELGFDGNWRWRGESSCHLDLTQVKGWFPISATSKKKRKPFLVQVKTWVRGKNICSAPELEEPLLKVPPAWRRSCRDTRLTAGICWQEHRHIAYCSQNLMIKYASVTKCSRKYKGHLHKEQGTSSQRSRCWSEPKQRPVNPVSNEAPDDEPRNKLKGSTFIWMYVRCPPTSLTQTLRKRITQKKSPSLSPDLPIIRIKCHWRQKVPWLKAH